ncbi:hypothetical protein [Streptomyces sp. NPDC050355]
MVLMSANRRKRHARKWTGSEKVQTILSAARLLVTLINAWWG